MNLKRLVDGFIEAIADFDRSMFGLAGGLGPWLVPVAPALVYAYTFYINTVAQMGHLALLGASAIGLGLVVAGAMSSHTAMSLQAVGAPRGKVIACWALVIGYVILEIGGLILMSSFGGLKVVGVTASALTLIVYLARSFNQDLQRFLQEKESTRNRQRNLQDEARQHELAVDSETRAFEREKELLQLNLKHQQKMAKIQSSNQVSNQVSKSLSTKLSKEAQIQRIIEILTDNPTPNFTAVALQLGVSRQTLYNRLDEMHEQELIEKDGSGIRITSIPH